MPKIYTDGGYINGFNVPAHAVLELVWLPDTPPDALMTLHGNGITQHVLAKDVDAVSFSSNGATFFSHRVGTAALATAVDRWLAGWSGHMTFTNGDYLAWTVVAGPPPSAQVLSALEARLARARTPQARVKFMNDQIMVGAQHDGTLLRSSAQAEQGDSILAYLTEMEDAADRGDFPDGAHVFVTGDEHGIAMALSLAIVRFLSSTLDCFANLLALDPETLAPDPDPETLRAASAAIGRRELLWINAYKQDVRPGSAWGAAVADLVLEPDGSQESVVVVTVDPSAARWLAAYELPTIYPY